MNKRLAAKIAVWVAGLTLVTLVLDLPDKIFSGLRSYMFAAPSLNFKAPFGETNAPTISFFTEDKEKGHSQFEWKIIYEVHNTGLQDLTIKKIRNIIPEVRAGEHVLKLVQKDKGDQLIWMFNNLQATSGGADKAQGDKLPITIKAGAKVYLQLLEDYRILDNGNALFCKSEAKCYQLLSYALGVPPTPEGTPGCIDKKFETVVEFERFRDLVAPQRTILLIPGCKLDLSKFQKHIKAPK